MKKLTGLAAADAFLKARESQPPNLKDKLTLVNETVWHSGDLRRIAERVCDEMKVSRRRNVTVVYRESKRVGSCTGLAVLNGRWLRMRVPYPSTGLEHPDTPMREFPVLDYARVLWHEVQHNIGQNHDSMSDCRMLSTQHLPWTAEYKVRGPKPKKKVPLKEALKKVVEQREKVARRNLEVWEARAKRAKTLVQKWKAKVRYYEKAAAKRAACVSTEVADGQVPQL